MEKWTHEDVVFWATQLAKSGLADVKTRKKINNNWQDVIVTPSPEEMAIRMRIAHQCGADPVAGALDVAIVAGRPVVRYVTISAAMQSAGYDWTIIEESEWRIVIALTHARFDESVKYEWQTADGVILKGQGKLVTYLEEDFGKAGDLMANMQPARYRKKNGDMGAVKVADAVRAGVRMGRVIRKAYARYGSGALSNLSVVEHSEARIVRETEQAREPEPVPEPTAVSVGEGHGNAPPAPPTPPVQESAATPPVQESAEETPPQGNPQARANWLAVIKSKLAEEPFAAYQERIREFMKFKTGAKIEDMGVVNLEKLANWMNANPDQVCKSASEFKAPQGAEE